jgi:prophage regulatory protein
MPIRVLSINQLADKGVRFSRAHIYRLIKQGSFPRPIRLGAQRIGFIEFEIDAWIQSKISNRDGGADAEKALKLSERGLSAAKARHRNNQVGPRGR